MRFKKHPLQNRTIVQTKGGGVKGLLNNVQKNCTFLNGWLPLCVVLLNKQALALTSTVMMKGFSKQIMMMLRMKWRSTTGESPTSTRSLASPLYSRYVPDDEN